MEVIEFGRRRVAHTEKVRKEEANKKNFCYFGYLPNEILVVIFSFLSKGSFFVVPQVCKRWNSLYSQIRSWLLREKLFKVQAKGQPPSPRLCHSAVSDNDNLYVIGKDVLPCFNFSDKQ